MVPEPKVVMLGGEEFFRESRREFMDDTAQMEICLKWESSVITGKEAERLSRGGLKGLSPKSFDNPIFTKFVDPSDPMAPQDLFFEDEDMIIFPNRFVQPPSSHPPSTLLPSLPSLPLRGHDHLPQ
jgi:hypothetical protein